MSRYSEQLKRDAVAFHENNEDLSLNAASAELCINRASLHSWVKKYSTGKRARIKAVHKKAQTANASERIRQLEKEYAKLREERDILRKAAKLSAEEMRLAPDVSTFRGQAHLSRGWEQDVEALRAVPPRPRG